jgi:hypothetical protein
LKLPQPFLFNAATIIFLQTWNFCVKLVCVYLGSAQKNFYLKAIDMKTEIHMKNEAEKNGLIKQKTTLVLRKTKLRELNNIELMQIAGGYSLVSAYTCTHSNLVDLS